MKALILAAMISANPSVIGQYATMRFMDQRDGEPLILVQSWDALTCNDKSKNISIRMLANEKTITVTCE